MSTHPSNASTSTRHVDDGLGMWAYAEGAIVVCPECEGPARTERSGPCYPVNARLRCLRCAYALNEPRWCGPVVMRTARLNGGYPYRCPNCGVKGLEKTVRFDHLPARTSGTAPCTCANCGASSEVPVQYEPDRSASPVDYAFGLPLWLQAPCAGHTLWAYNEEHLDVLASYLAARLRERMRNANGSMLARLPRWLTSAKHRDEVAKGVRRLQTRLAEAGA